MADVPETLPPDPARAVPAVAHLLTPVPLAHPFWLHFEAHQSQPFPFLLDSANPMNGLGRFSFLGSRPVAVFRAKRTTGGLAEMTITEGGHVTRATADPFAALRALLHRWRVEPHEWQQTLSNPEPPVSPTRERGPNHPSAVASNLGDPEPPVSPTRERGPNHFLEQAGGRRSRVGLTGQGRSEGQTALGEGPRPTPIPFLAGAVGYFAYEARHYVEPMPADSADPLGLPDVHFALYDALLAHDHETGETVLSVVGRGRDDAEARQRAEQARDEWLAELRTFTPAPPAGGPTHLPEVTTNADRAAYSRMVTACKDHIAAGDVFQVCLTRRLRSPFRGDPWRLYQELRRHSPAPFACFLSLPEAAVVSSSPERFIRLDAGRVAESRPIKGTRPRGKTPAEDADLRRELETSEKDRAENVMIVDLVRNDLGRVSQIGTVAVPELMKIEEYATVFQMVSTVRGRLRDGLDGLDLVKACFPGGSMTGAPKVEAMKIIDRVERVERGVYSGSIGYLDYSGRLDLNIVIRTLVIKDGVAHFGTGGAVVADSDPAGEFEETVAKVRATLAALADTPE